MQFAISKESGFGLLVELNYLKKETKISNT
jgi:hypothetical protein